MDKTRLFWASSISMATTAISFAVRGDAAVALAADFQLSKAQLGLMFSPVFWCFTIAILLCGLLIDRVGMRVLHALSGVGYLLGTGLVLLAPPTGGPVASFFDAPGTAMLYVGFMLMGLAQGLVEGVTNPLIATLYRDAKVKQLNVLHAWYPGGLILGGLTVALLGGAFDAGWQLKMGLVLIPSAIYLVMALRLRYPPTESVESQRSSGETWRALARPLFLVLFAGMWLTSAVELGPDQWFPVVMGALVPQLEGVLFLVYTAGLMFALRAFAAGLADRRPLLTLLVCSLLSAVGLYWLGSLEAGSTSALTAFAAATVFGIGRSFFWPTMLGVVAEKVPRGGALALCLMGGAGMASVSIILPVMGARMDQLGAGAALQMVGAMALVLVVLFAALMLYFQRRGGYRQG